MNRMSAVVYLSWLDFLQRVRSRSFLFVMGLIAIVGISSLPKPGAMFQTMIFNEYRGLYNSAWVGILIALLTSFCFTLFGFYIIKGRINHDVKSGVKEMVASTPVTKTEYLASKVMSNVYWLLSIAFFVIFAGIVMQLIRGEDPNLNLWCFVKPFLWFTIPVIFFLSSLAVLFETIPFLSNTLGNVFYFFVSLVIFHGWNSGISYLDLIGGSMVFSQIVSDFRLVHPEYGGGWTFIGGGARQVTEPILWNGLSWTGEMLVQRAMWVLIAGGLFVIATRLFNRFVDKKTTMRSHTQKGKIDSVPLFKKKSEIHLLLLRTSIRRKNLAGLLWTEFKFSIMGMNKIWYLAAGILLLLCALTESQGDHNILLPLVWLLPIGIWSQKGIKIAGCELNQITRSTVNAVPWHCIAEYLSGFLMAVFFAGLLLVRLAISGLWVNVLYIVLGSVFIASLAFFLGFWTKGPKTFEVVYLMLWYLGPMNRTGLLDFTGSAPGIKLNQFFALYFPLSLIMILSVIMFKTKKRGVC